MDFSWRKNVAFALLKSDFYPKETSGFKGLRLGVNATGKKYLQAGRDAIFFPKKMSKKEQRKFFSLKKNPTLYSEMIIKKNIWDRIDSLTFKIIYIVFFLMSFSYLSLFLLTIPVGLVLFVNFFLKRKNKKFIKKFFSALSEEDTEFILASLQNLSKNIWGKKKRQKFLIDYYLYLCWLFVEEGQLDKTEEGALVLISEQIAREQLKIMNEFFLNDFISFCLKDDHLSLDEEVLLNKLAQIMVVDADVQAAVKSKISDFLELEKIEKKEFKKIIPSFKISKKEICYYEKSIFVCLSKMQNNERLFFEKKTQFF